MSFLGRTNTLENRDARENLPERLFNNPGNDLLSHAVTSAVPSALEGLTSVFGMGTGVAPPASPPGIEISRRSLAAPNTEILECSQTPHLS